MPCRNRSGETSPGRQHQPVEAIANRRLRGAARRSSGSSFGEIGNAISGDDPTEPVSQDERS